MKRHWAVTMGDLGDWLGSEKTFDLWLVQRFLKYLQKSQVTLQPVPTWDRPVFQFGATRMDVRKLIPDILRVWARTHSALYHRVLPAEVEVTLLPDIYTNIPADVQYAWETTPLIGEMHHV